jgi:hypothetical protein
VRFAYSTLQDPTLKKTEDGAPCVGQLTVFQFRVSTHRVQFILRRIKAGDSEGQEARGKLTIRTRLVVFRE